MNTPAPQAAPNGHFRGADPGHDESVRSGGPIFARGRNGLHSYRRDDSPELREDTPRSGMPSSPKVLRFMVSSLIFFGPIEMIMYCFNIEAEIVSTGNIYRPCLSPDHDSCSSIFLFTRLEW